MIRFIDSASREHVEAADRPAPPGRKQEAAEHPYGGRFSRPVRPEESEYLSLFHLKADVVHGDKSRRKSA